MSDKPPIIGTDPSDENVENENAENSPLSQEDEKSELRNKIEAWQTDQDFDDDLGDFKLPEMNWEGLEAKLKEAALEENMKQNQRLSYNLDREEIRRKLAMVSSSSSSSSSNDPTITVQLAGNQDDNNDDAEYFRSSAASRSKLGHHGGYMGQNLQICFMNESMNDDSTENESGELGDDFVVKTDRADVLKAAEPATSDRRLSSSDKSEPLKETKVAKDITGELIGQATQQAQPPSFAMFSFDSESLTNCEDVLLNLQSQAQQALAKVKLQVKQKLDAERKASMKPSPIADIVGLSTYGLKRLEKQQMIEMNIGQLQVIVNDLCNQIEKINEELKKMLIDRDDLYMQQDAILVDVEDFTKRIQEISQRRKAKEAAVSSSKSQSQVTSPSNSNSNSSNFAASAKNFSSSLAIGSKVSAFFNQYTAAMNSPDASNGQHSPRASKLFSSLTNKLYGFKK